MGSPRRTDPASPVPDDRLDGWKEIASFLGRGVRTVQRWETALGLPVHRLRHERGEVVFALEGEVPLGPRDVAVVFPVRRWAGTRFEGLPPAPVEIDR